MGGHGSGRSRYSYRYTVEDCERLSISALLQRNLLAEDALMPVYLRAPCLTLEIERDGARVSVRIRQTGQVVRLRESLLNYGGLRWWFACPACSKRRTDLYLPPYGDKFLCRACHDLAYQSSRRSHNLDSVYAMIAARSGYSFDEVKRAAREEMQLYAPARRWIRRRDRLSDEERELKRVERMIRRALTIMKKRSSVAINFPLSSG